MTAEPEKVAACHNQWFRGKAFSILLIAFLVSGLHGDASTCIIVSRPRCYAFATTTPVHRSRKPGMTTRYYWGGFGPASNGRAMAPALVSTKSRMLRPCWICAGLALPG